MKTLLFADAIKKRNRVRFFYDLSEIMIEPYYVLREKTGRKVLYGRILNSNEVKKFNFSRIANIKVIDDKRFSPIIPIIPLAS